MKPHLKMIPIKGRYWIQTVSTVILTRLIDLIFRAINR